MRTLVLFVGFLGACATRAEDFGAASAAGACEWVARCGGLESSGYASLDDCVDQTVAGSAAYYKCEIELCEFDPKAVTKSEHRSQVELRS